MHRFRSITILFMASLFMLVIAPRAFADSPTVSVMLNEYTGRWAVAGTIYIDDQSLTLDPGTYSFDLVGVKTNYFQFTVDSSGNVTVSNPDLAVGGAGTLALTTHAVSVNMSDYVGRWLSGADGVVASIYEGNQTVKLAAATYRFGLMNVNGDLFQYTVDSSGNVTVSNSDLATGGANTLTLITHPISVNMSDYVGRWLSGADHVTASLNQGNQTVKLAAATYRFGLMDVNSDLFQYTVDSSGNVTVSNLDLATGGAGILTLITHPISVNASNYVGRWLSGADHGTASVNQGNQTVQLAAATYRFGLVNVNSNLFQYTVDSSGNVTVSNLDLATGGAGTLTLITHPVSVNVSNYAGRWQSGADGVVASTYEGDQTIYLAATTYRFGLIRVTNNLFQYTVDISGNVTVADPTLATGGVGMLTLITHPIVVNVSNYPGHWQSGADETIASRYQGNQTIYLAATTYQLDLVRIINDYFQYTVDSSGNVTASDSHKAVTSANQLTLITRAIDFDLGGAPGIWQFSDFSPFFSGNQTLCLLPTAYTFKMATDSVDYEVANNGAPYLFTVSPNSALITVNDVPYTVSLSVSPRDNGCYVVPQWDWDALYRAIAEAHIDVPGVRHSLVAKVDAAKAAYETGDLVASGNILCALLHEVDAQDGKHIEPASAADIRDTAVNVAEALNIPLACLEG